MDGETFLILAMMALFIGAFAALVIWSIRSEKRRQAEFAELAVQRGWSYDYVKPGRGRRSGVLRFTGPDGDWTLEITRRRSSGGKGSSRSSSPGSSIFRAPAPALPGGLVVAMAEKPQALTKMLPGMTGLFDNVIGRSLLNFAVGPEVAQHVGQLQSFDTPAELRINVMATADPTLWFDMESIARAVHGWNPRKSGDRGPPIVMIGETGLTLRLSYELGDAALIAQFIDLALETQPTLNRPAGS